jgi:hypothetical protein
VQVCSVQPSLNAGLSAISQRHAREPRRTGTRRQQSVHDLTPQHQRASPCGAPLTDRMHSMVMTIRGASVALLILALVALVVDDLRSVHR